MRNMSFALTEDQLLDGTKTVTRRLGWKALRPGDRLWAVRKAMGLKKGERVHRLGVIEVTNVRRVRLDTISEDELRREGFPFMTPAEFVELFCRHMGCRPDDQVTRIEFTLERAIEKQVTFV